VGTDALSSQVVVATGTKPVFRLRHEPEDMGGKLAGRGDWAVQARQVFANLGRALAAAGALTRHVAKITIYVVNCALRSHHPPRPRLPDQGLDTISCHRSRLTTPGQPPAAQSPNSHTSQLQ